MDHRDLRPHSAAALTAQLEALAALTNAASKPNVTHYWHKLKALITNHLLAARLIEKTLHSSKVMYSTAVKMITFMLELLVFGQPFFLSLSSHTSQFLIHTDLSLVRFSVKLSLYYFGLVVLCPMQTHVSASHL